MNKEERPTKRIKRYILTDDALLAEQPAASYDKALHKLHKYVEEQNKKWTTEREVILNIIYRVDRLIAPPTLHQLVCNHHCSVSLASVYNTLLLLLELGLIRKVIFPSDSTTYYERALDNPAHPFAICPTCKVVWSLPPMQFAEEMNSLLPSRFYPSEHTMIIEGVCQKCHQNKKKMQEKAAKQQSKKIKKQHKK
ncbi:MAG: transcriptional repressor [Bacteroidales bacterium]|nr:transcriptional repressor [Bacteroidales bacterium]